MAAPAEQQDERGEDNALREDVAVLVVDASVHRVLHHDAVHERGAVVGDHNHHEAKRREHDEDPVDNERSQEADGEHGLVAAPTTKTIVAKNSQHRDAPIRLQPPASQDACGGQAKGRDP